jgi:uncharacterized protein (DUF305 family)
MTTLVKLTFAAAVATAALSISTFGASAEMAYPEKCKADKTSMAKMDMPGGGMKMSGGKMAMGGMTDYQKASMEGMKSMGSNMEQGMMKKGADVSFICGMIAHHMGAISMSQVELKYGKDEWAKKMAQMIIDAQEKEIKEMSGWLDTAAK